MKYKQLTKDTMYREGTVYCRLWDRDIDIALYDERVTFEYAEKCVQAMNSMPPELIEAICQAAKRYCLCFQEDIGKDLSDEMTVPITEDTPASEILKCCDPAALIVDVPKDENRIGYQLSCNCDWEQEHGMEIDILDNRLVYLSEYTGDSPWNVHTDEPWDYAERNEEAR